MATPETPAHLEVALRVEKPTEAELGLLLLLLKDLWTGDLPVGGEIGLGRGRFRGKTATLTYTPPGEEEAVETEHTWTFSANKAGGLVIGGSPEPLEAFVTALHATDSSTPTDHA